jgi:hypothetical protein
MMTFDQKEVFPGTLYVEQDVDYYYYELIIAVNDVYDERLQKHLNEYTILTDDGRIFISYLKMPGTSFYKFDP